MKKSVVLVSLIFIASLLWAQNSYSLEKICESLSSHPITTGDFIQTKKIQTNGRKLKSTGTYIISPDGIVWSTEKPIYSSLILTKTAVVQIAANGKKSVLSGNDNQIFTNSIQMRQRFLYHNTSAPSPQLFE